RWGTLYNFRFDSSAPPTVSEATVGFFKTGSPVTVDVVAPFLSDATPTATPTGTATATATASPTPTATATPGISSTPTPPAIATEDFRCAERHASEDDRRKWKRDAEP